MINFQTKIINTNTQKEYIPFVTNLQKGDNNELSVDIAIKVNDNKVSIGICNYKILKDSLFIGWMENRSPTDLITGRNLYNHVGSAIHEYIFKKSIMLGKEGRVTLNAAFGAEIFHFKLGFSVEPGKCRSYFLNSNKVNPDILINLHDLISEYDYEKTYNAQKNINLIKNIVFDIFDEIYININNLVSNTNAGFLSTVFLLDDINSIMDKLFEFTDHNEKIKNRITSNSSYIDYKASYPMFLSDKSINNKKIKFRILDSKTVKEQENEDNCFEINLILNRCSEIIELKNNISLSLFEKFIENIEEYHRKLIEQDYDKLFTTSLAALPR